MSCGHRIDLLAPDWSAPRFRLSWTSVDATRGCRSCEGLGLVIGNHDCEQCDGTGHSTQRHSRVARRTGALTFMRRWRVVPDAAAALDVLFPISHRGPAPVSESLQALSDFP